MSKTTEDALCLLAKHPEWTSGKIAKSVGCSDRYIRKLREQRAPLLQTKLNRRLGLDGRWTMVQNYGELSAMQKLDKLIKKFSNGLTTIGDDLVVEIRRKRISHLEFSAALTARKKELDEALKQLQKRASDASSSLKNRPGT